MCSAPWSHATHGPTRCGQCMECRLAYSREWAIRITHEQQMHDRSCFITLTYDDLNLPRFGQLVKRDLQLFFKRLRKFSGPFRYVACGEYGELKRRPHFHAAIFGLDFASDRIPYGEGIRGDPIFVSNSLASAWGKSVFPMGHTVGSLTFESAAYISRYITKRISGTGCSPLPLACDPESGELIMPNPEFLLMSKGIGKSWFREYFMTDVFPHARVITSQGSPAPVPRYYKDLLKDLGGDLALEMSFRGSKNIDAVEFSRRIENSAERRASRAIYAKARTGVFTRDVRG